MRRSHHALAKINVILDKESGEYRLPHHMNSLDGKYNNKQILSVKESSNIDE